jgi:membrane fusion protein (multidrug efflux system)
MLDEETHMCPAYVTIECQDCIIGQTVPIDVAIAEHRSVLVIPYEAVFLRDGKSVVYIMKENKATLQPVTLGLREKERIEVQRGLKSGDQVIVRGQTRLYPGAPVVVAPQNNTHS